jgi:propionyl-CoA carboxylase alpha chain
VTYRDGDGTVEITYVLGPQPSITVDGTPAEVEVTSASPDAVELVAGGVRRRYLVDVEPDHAEGSGEQSGTVWVDSPRGGLRLVRQPRFPPPEASLAAGSMLAPMPGTVISVSVAEGDRVEAGQRLLVLEAMKMEHVITAGGPGTVSALNVAPGDTVAQGLVLIAVEPDEA